MTELKPCPFCGEKASEWLSMAYGDGKFNPAVGCSNPKCHLRVFAVHPKRGIAVNRWNRREVSR